MDNEHPDPTGPEKPEGPKAAHDGQPNGGKNVAETAVEEETEVQESPMEGDGQLTLGGLGVPRRASTVAHVSMQSARREIDGRLDPERDHVFIVKGRVAGVSADYTRIDDASAKISSAAATQKVRPLSIGRVAVELEEAVSLMGAIPKEAAAQAARELTTLLERHVSEEERERHLALV